MTPAEPDRATWSLRELADKAEQSFIAPPSFSLGPSMASRLLDWHIGVTPDVELLALGSEIERERRRRADEH